MDFASSFVDSDNLPEAICQGCGACLLFVVQRSSEGGEWRVVVADELAEEVLNEI